MGLLQTDIVLLAAYLFVGPIVWAVYGTLITAGRRRMLLLRRPPRPFKETPPSVTILIPAKDEGERIRACILSALEQDYSPFDVIAINDRSVDNTGKIMDELAAANPKLSVVHIQEGTLQPGWTGKNNALFQGQRHAKGQWLLFVDSDVILERDAVTASMSVVLNKKFDMLSLLPKLESHTIWESMLVPLAASTAASMYLIALTNNALMPNRAFANGQFLLVSRQAYDAFGGHDVVKDRYCEDVEIAQIMKRNGMRPRVSWGNEWCRVRMYSSLANIFKGWSRIYYAARVGSPWTILAAIAFLIVACASWFPAVGYALYRVAVGYQDQITLSWLLAAAAHAGLMLFYIARLYHWSGNPRRNALLFPLAGTMLMGILLRALRMCITKKVEWRGTSYNHQMADLSGAKVRAGANP